MAQNLNQFIKETVNNGGCTYSLFEGCSPKTGYVVSIIKQQTIIPKMAFGRYSLAGFIREHAVKFCEPDYYLGSWIENDDVYLDVVMVTDSLETAKRVARQNEQLAIFDLSKMETIYL